MNWGLLVQVTAVIMFVVGLGFSFAQNKPTVFSYWSAFQTIYRDIMGDRYFEKERIEIEPFKINRENPNPELVYDSTYNLNIVTSAPITNFSFRVKLFNSASIEMPAMLHNDDNRGETAFYEPKIENGFAFFEVRNAGGEYNLELSHKEVEYLNEKDISW